MPTLPERLAVVLASIGTEGSKALDALDELYAPHLLFVDPIQQITGRAEFRLMNERLLARAAYLRFEDVSMMGEEPHFAASWKMVFRPKLGPELSTYGTSEFRSEDGLVVFQRDYWDLLGFVMSGFPHVEPIYKRLVARIG